MYKTQEKDAILLSLLPEPVSATFEYYIQVLHPRNLTILKVKLKSAQTFDSLNIQSHLLIILILFFGWVSQGGNSEPLLLNTI